MQVVKCRRCHSLDKEQLDQLKKQFHGLVKNIDETLHKKLGNEVFQSVEQFIKNIPLTGNFQLDWTETDAEYLLKANIAGVPKDEINIDLVGNQLRISYRSISETTEKRYSRSFTFHQPIIEEKIVANHQDGLLIITIPKSTTKKNIEIS